MTLSTMTHSITVKIVALSIMAIDTVMLGVSVLGVVCSKWHQADCHCADSRGIHSKLEYNNVFIV